MTMFDRLNNAWAFEQHNLCANKSTLSSVSIRYNTLLPNWLTYVKGYRTITNHDQTVWLYTESDYSGLNNSAFEWNFIEAISLESCVGDLNETNEIISYWNKVLPIGMSVRGGYSFYGLLEGNKFVTGIEPAFSDHTIIGNEDSFVRLLNEIA